MGWDGGWPSERPAVEVPLPQVKTPINLLSLLPSLLCLSCSLSRDGLECLVAC